MKWWMAARIFYRSLLRRSQRTRKEMLLETGGEKGDTYYVVAECLATLLPEEMWKKERVPNGLMDLARKFVGKTVKHGNWLL